MKLERSLKRNFNLRRQQARCPRARSLSMPGAWCEASTTMTSVKALYCWRSYCPKVAKRSSGIMSSTWLWGTTASRNMKRP
ncbi:fission, mitochondrial 1 [Phyllostomus discolor]|uniref:Fission, mitochondrial 1 n=1 Tax=Phyllostomus discolor TaxID=89673 RepID=A0A834EPI3_9CHIR|nr:fission, mitochondrial 1 [Phyllostomus discolor]